MNKNWLVPRLKSTTGLRTWINVGFGYVVKKPKIDEKMAMGSQKWLVWLRNHEKIISFTISKGLKT